MHITSRILQSSGSITKIESAMPDQQSPHDHYDYIDAVADTTLFGLQLINAAPEKVARAIVSLGAKGRNAQVYFINAHCINSMATDPDYHDVLRKATLLLPDGSGLRFAARLAGQRLDYNLNGTDLFPMLCEHAAIDGVGLYLLGGEDGVAATVRTNMVARYPNLQIAGAQNGRFSADAEEAVIAAINNSGAKILLVGMGVPLQEKWIARNHARLNVPMVLGVGGLFDYYSGRIPRAPRMMRNAGIEWVWRLLQEPRRLLWRYTVGNAAFLCRACGHAVETHNLEVKLYKMIKRVIDFSCSVAALIAISPLFIFICALIKYEDRGPIFFKQLRIGDCGKPFLMWKFRSMVINAEALRAALLANSDRDSVCFKMKKDPRVTKIGAWLRRFSLDELPQIINVVRGEMSIVGPRPALPQEVVKYDDHSRQRLFGLPGLTCSWQVSGRANISFAQQVNMDVDYLKNSKTIDDFKLILKTIPAVLSGHGAF